MPESEEIVALLREIRDLQKAYFERYQEFTAFVTKRDEEARKEAAQRRGETRETVEQSRRQLAEFRSSARRTRIVMYVLCALLLLCVLGFPLISLIVGMIRSILQR